MRKLYLASFILNNGGKENYETSRLVLVDSSDEQTIINNFYDKLDETTDSWQLLAARIKAEEWAKHRWKDDTGIVVKGIVVDPAIEDFFYYNVSSEILE